MAYYPFATEFGARYTLIGPDGSVAVFNEPDDPNYVGFITELTGLDSADVRESASELVEADGGSHGAFYFSRRPIVVTATIANMQSILERNLRLDRARRASNALRSDGLLSWKPSRRRENFITNPRIVTTTGWTSSFSSGFTGTSFTASGSGGRVQATQPSDSTARSAYIRTATGTSGLTVVPGRSYYAQGQATHTNAPATGSRVDIYWWKADGSAASTASTAGSYAGPNTTGVFTPSVTGTAPADAAYASLRLLTDTATSGDVIDVTWTSAMLTEASMGTTYLDGATTGFFWQGDADASPSGDFVEMFTTIRRNQPFRETGQWVKSIQMSLVSEYAFLYSTQVKTVAAGVAAENRGSAPFFPVVTFTGPSVAPTLTDGARTFKTNTATPNNLSLVTGEKLQVDFLNHTSTFIAGTRNGLSGNRYIDWSGTTWPYLAPNAVTTFTLTGGGTASVAYRDAWV